MSNKKLSDDIYVFTYYDPEEDELSMEIVNSLEDFQKFQKNVQIVGWGNITGKEMEITQFHANSALSFVDSSTRMTKDEGKIK